MLFDEKRTGQPPCNRPSCNWFEYREGDKDGTHAPLTIVMVFTASLTAANVRHKCKQHRRLLNIYIDLYRQGIPSCTLFHYTVYSHYTATIQPLYSPRK